MKNNVKFIPHLISKHTLVSILFSLLFTLPSSASTHEGYYVTLSNDTIWGIIKTPECFSLYSDRIHSATFGSFYDKEFRIQTTFEDSLQDVYDNLYERQFHMTFEDSAGNSYSLTPNSVSVVVVLKSDAREIYQSFKTLELEHVFLKYVVLGKVSLLCEYYTDEETHKQTGSLEKHLRTCYIRQERYYILKGNNKVIPVYETFFKKTMNKCFADDLELISKIEKGTYKYHHLKTIVMEYNYWINTVDSLDKN